MSLSYLSNPQVLNAEQEKIRLDKLAAQKLEPLSVNQPEEKKGSGFDVAGGVATALDSIGNVFGNSDESDSGINQEFINRNKDIMGQSDASNLNDAATDVISEIPGWGAIAGAGLKAGKKLINSSKDEYGIVDNKASFIAGSIMNPIDGISYLANQKKLKYEANLFKEGKTREEVSNSKSVGANISNAVPQQQTYSYGKNGMKLTTPRTQFSIQTRKL